MTLANVALTDTFDLWRTRTNQLVFQSNFYKDNYPNYLFANNIGVTANAFASSTIAGANAAIGLGANSYANVVWSRANTRMDLGGFQANSFASATIAGANTAVGEAANNFTKATLNGANTAARDATNLTSGTVPSARISGSYTGITGVGTITTGVWNGTDIAVADGGTGASDAGTARTNLGLVIGTNVQAWDANLDQIAALAPTLDNFIVGNGTAWTLETPASARTSLGLGTIATQGSGAVTITGGSITGITDITLADGGTNASLTACSGAVVYSTSSAFSFTAVGTSGQLLQSGATGAPSWISPASLTVGNASKLATLDAAYSATGSSIAARDSAADIQARLFRSEYTDQTGIEGSIAFRTNNTNDNYIRFCNTPSAVRTWLGLGTIATQGSGAVSITGGSISGLSSLGVSGDITATGDITAFSSDARLKGDIQTITDALSKVKLITGVTYVHNDIAKSFGYTDEKRLAGVLAQEVEAVLPEVVVPAPFDVADDGTSKSGENYKTVKYDKIVPLLIEAIKELTAKVEMLESKIEK